MILPDIYQLKCFLAVAEKKSFSGAAESLFISRQALTKTIQRIEKSLGVPLFEPCGRSLELTSAGQALYNHSIPLINSWLIFEENMHQYMAGQSMLLQIVFSQGTLIALGKDFLLKFRTLYPNIRLSSEEMSPDAVTQMVRAGDAEVGILGSVPEYLTEFHTIYLQHTGMWLQFSADDPLACKEILVPADLAGKPIIGPGPHNHQHRYFVRECRRAGVEPYFPLMMSYSSTGEGQVEKGAFYYSFPETVHPVMDGYVVRQIRLPGDDLLGTYAITKKGRVSASAKQFLSYLQTLWP